MGTQIEQIPRYTRSTLPDPKGAPFLDALIVIEETNGTRTVAVSNGAAWVAVGSGGGGSGDMLASNALSELSGSAATARANIGVPAAANPALSGTGTGTLAIPVTWTVPTPTAGDNTTKLSNTAFVQAAIAALVASSPAALDTLNELAAALGNDANYAATITAALAGKQPSDTDLTAFAALVSAANKLAYATGAGTWALTDITAAARTFLAAADAAAQRAATGAATKGTVIPLAGTSLVLTVATHDGHIVETQSGSATSVTLASTEDLVEGIEIKQAGAGVATLSGTATFNAPNGLTTGGPGTSMFIRPTGTADTYDVVVAPTADKTLINATAGATPAVAMNLYNVVDLTLTANCTPAFSGAVSGQTFSTTLIIHQDAGTARTFTLPTTKWGTGVTPWVMSTTLGATDIITLATLTGGAPYYGFIGGKAFA